MKVFAILHYPIYGGPHNNFVTLARALSDRGIDLELVLPDQPGNAADRIRSAGVAVHQVQLGRARATRSLSTHANFLWHYYGDIARLRHLFDAAQPDAVVLSSTINLHPGLAARWSKVPIVWQIVDTHTPRFLVRPSVAVIYQLSSATMFWGQYVRDFHHYDGTSPSRPSVLAHSAVDLRVHRPNSAQRLATRERLSIGDHDLVIGHVANMNPQKGLTDLIAAFAEIHRSLPETHFIQVGASHGTHKAYLAEVARLIADSGIPSNQLHFVGGSSSPEEFYPAFDVQVMSSVADAEGIPTVVLEGMATGLPVVATRSGSTAEIVLDGITGFVVEPSKPSELAGRVLELMRDPDLRARFGDAGLARARADFGIDSVADLHASIIRQAVDFGVPAISLRPSRR